jgi:hypothetical protein
MTIQKLKGSNKTLSALGMECFGLGEPYMRADGSYLAYGKVSDNTYNCYQ